MQLPNFVRQAADFAKDLVMIPLEDARKLVLERAADPRQIGGIMRNTRLALMALAAVGLGGALIDCGDSGEEARPDIGPYLEDGIPWADVLDGGAPDTAPVDGATPESPDTQPQSACEGLETGEPCSPIECGNGGGATPDGVGVCIENGRCANGVVEIEDPTNGKDDDCDGQTDEGPGPVGEPTADAGDTETPTPDAEAEKDADAGIESQPDAADGDASGDIAEPKPDTDEPKPEVTEAEPDTADAGDTADAEPQAEVAEETADTTEVADVAGADDEGAEEPEEVSVSDGDVVLEEEGEPGGGAVAVPNCENQTPGTLCAPPDYGTGKVGICTAQEKCEGETGPEVCDEKDNNGDGKTDNVPGAGEPCNGLEAKVPGKPPFETGCDQNGNVSCISKGGCNPAGSPLCPSGTSPFTGKIHDSDCEGTPDTTQMCKTGGLASTGFCCDLDNDGCTHETGDTNEGANNPDECL